jgi:hypothetical protein
MTKNILCILSTFILICTCGCSYRLKYIVLDEISDNKWTEVKEADSQPPIQNVK